MELVSQCFAGVLALHSKHVLKSFLFAAQDLNLLLVRIKVLMELTARVCQTGELSFQVRGVLITSALHLAHGSLCDISIELAFVNERCIQITYLRIRFCFQRWPSLCLDVLL